MFLIKMAKPVTKIFCKINCTLIDKSKQNLKTVPKKIT